MAIVYYGLMKQSLRLLAYFLAAGIAAPALANTSTPAPSTPPSSAKNLREAVRAEDAKSQLDAELFYELLLGEMYAYRGEATTSVELLLDAARRSGDEKVYQRAAQIALLSRSAQKAGMVAQAWKSAYPNSRQASRYMLQVLLSTNHGEETGELLKQEIAHANPDDKLELIRAIPSIYRRVSDRAAATTIVRSALAPELENPATGPDAWAAIGAMELAADNKDAALAAARKALTLDANNKSAAKLATDLASAGVPGAESLVTSYLSQSNNADAHLAYARSLMNSDRLVEAQEQLNQATQLNPDSADAWILKAALEAQLKQYAEADVSLLKLDTLIDKFPSAALQREVRIQSLMLREQMAEAQKKWPEADQWADEIAKAGNVPLSTLRKASVRMQQGQYEEANALLEQLPENNPGEIRTKFSAQVQLQKTAKNYAKALEVQNKLVALSPNDPDALYEQAMLAERMNDMVQAESILRKLITIAPDNQHAYNALGYSLADRGLQLDEAKTLIEKALSLAPGDPFITDSLGWVEYKQGNLEKAATLLEQAYTQQPDAEIGAHLAEVWWKQGKTQSAEELLRVALKDSPGNAVVLKTFKLLGIQP